MQQKNLYFSVVSKTCQVFCDLFRLEGKINFYFVCAVCLVCVLRPTFFVYIPFISWPSSVVAATVEDKFCTNRKLLELSPLHSTTALYFPEFRGMLHVLHFDSRFFIQLPRVDFASNAHVGRRYFLSCLI